MAGAEAHCSHRFRYLPGRAPFSVLSSETSLEMPGPEAGSPHSGSPTPPLAQREAKALQLRPPDPHSMTQHVLYREVYRPFENREQGL